MGYCETSIPTDCPTNQKIDLCQYPGDKQQKTISVSVCQLFAYYGSGCETKKCSDWPKTPAPTTKAPTPPPTTTRAPTTTTRAPTTAVPSTTTQAPVTGTPVPTPPPTTTKAPTPAPTTPGPVTKTLSSELTRSESLSQSEDMGSLTQTFTKQAGTRTVSISRSLVADPPTCK